MNPHCPNCQYELEDDIGFINCPSCGKVCAIDLDGNVTLEGDKSQAAPPEDTVQEEALKDEELVAPLGEPDYLSGDGSDYENFDTGSAGLEQEQQGTESYEDSQSDLEETPLEHQEYDDKEYQGFEEESAQNFDDPVEDEISSEDQIDKSGPLSLKSFLEGLEILIDDEVSDETVLFDLHIGELNTQEDWNLVIEYLADSRLQFTEEGLLELKSHSSNEELVLKGLSLLRLTVIFKRISHLGYDLDWTPSDIVPVEEENFPIPEEPDDSQDYENSAGEEIEEEF